MTRKKKHNSGNAKVVYMFESHKSLGKNNNWSQIPVEMSEEGHELRRIADKTTNRQALLHEYLYKIPEPPAEFSPLMKTIFTDYYMKMRTKRQAEFAKLELVKNPTKHKQEEN